MFDANAFSLYDGALIYVTLSLFFYYFYLLISYVFFT